MSGTPSVTRRSWKSSVFNATSGAKIGIVSLLILVLLVGAGNLWATYSYVNQYKAQQHQNSVTQARKDAADKAAQERQGALVEHRLCDTLDRLASRRPPDPGPPGANPSREYDVWLHDTLSALGPDVGCPRTR